MGRLEGRVAIVTGGAGGIGSATCRALAREGASGGVAALDGRGAEKVAADLAAGLGIECDVADEASVTALIARTVETFGRLDVIHNNAALTSAAMLARDQDVTTMELEVWDAMFAVNLRSQMLVCKHAIPHLVAAGGG